MRSSLTSGRLRSARRRKPQSPWGAELCTKHVESKTRIEVQHERNLCCLSWNRSSDEASHWPRWWQRSTVGDMHKLRRNRRVLPCQESRLASIPARRVLYCAPGRGGHINFYPGDAARSGWNYIGYCFFGCLVSQREIGTGQHRDSAHESLRVIICCVLIARG